MVSVDIILWSTYRFHIVAVTVVVTTASLVLLLILKKNQLFRREHSIVRKFGVRIQGFMSCQGGLATSFCFPEFETSTPRFPKRVDHRDGRIQLYALFSIANDMCFLSR